MTRAEHGTTARNKAGCRCLPCRAAAARYASEADAARRRGDWQPFVDAAPTREHLLELRRAGVHLSDIAATARVGVATISNILYGKPTSHRPPATRIRPQTAAALLAVPVPAATPPGRNGVPAERTWALLRALVAHGYTMDHLAQLLGHTSRCTLKLGKAQRVTARTAATVDRLVDQLAGAPGPSDRARRYAAARGWTTDALTADLALDEEGDTQTLHTVEVAVIDMVAVERFADGWDVDLTRAERVEAAWEMLRRGHSQNEVVQRLHVNSITWRQIRDQLSATGRTIESLHRREGAA